MRVDRYVTMVVNTVIRQLVNIGVNKGFNWLSRRNPPKTPATPAADARQRQQARETAKRARQAAKITRRLR